MLRFLMFHQRKSSVRDTVIGKKWIYLGKNTLHTQSVNHLRRPEWYQDMGLSVFIEVGNYTGRRVGGVLQLFGERGEDFQELGHCPHFVLETVVAPLGISLSSLIC